jgi:hypothetical protein
MTGLIAAVRTHVMKSLRPARASYHDVIFHYS